MTVLLLGVIFAFVLYEIEGLSHSQAVTAAQIVRFRRLRGSMVMLAFLALAVLLSATEIYFYATGQLYKEGIGLAGFIRLLLLMAGLSAVAFIRFRRAKSLNVGGPTYVVTMGLAVLLALSVVFWK